MIVKPYIAEASNSQLHIIIVDLSIKHGLCTRLKAHLHVRSLLSWLDKLGQPDAEHICIRLWLLDLHGCYVVVDQLECWKD